MIEDSKEQQEVPMKKLKIRIVKKKIKKQEETYSPMIDQDL